MGERKRERSEVITMVTNISVVTDPSCSIISEDLFLSFSVHELCNLL